MAENMQVKIDGLDQVMKRLETMGPELRKKGLRTAMRAAANTVKKSAQAKAPVDTGAMRKNITIQAASRTAKRVGGVAFRVGVKGGALAPGSKVRYGRSRKGKKGGQAEGGSTWYFRLVELGTSKMPARPFLQPALRDNVSKIIGQVASDINTALDKMAAKGVK